ncbi:helix-turn-helix domain-containing protein [Staphylococcus delphini]|uniref:helix-turn-helix domain-containing protein n=1 Tax=Staphylococcus delphini TaxID=53344 RepID=UPI0015C89FC2|nr:helix-turn-helix transcriptional regulator [Staphylococcus delphini]
MIGKIIKQKRLDAKMSQSELAKGITSQALISRLEKGEVDVSAQILFELSKKLNFSIDEIFSQQKSHNLSYPCIDSLLNDLDNSLLIKDYFFLAKCKNNPLLERNSNSKVMNGIISILHSFYVIKDFNYCENKLEELLNTEEDIIPELHFRLLIFSGYLNINKNPSKSEKLFKKAYKLLKKFKISIAPTLFFYAFYSELLFNLKNYNMLNKLSKEGLEVILNKKVFFYFENIAYYYFFSQKHVNSSKQYIEIQQFALWYSKFNEKKGLYKFFNKI